MTVVTNGSAAASPGPDRSSAGGPQTQAFDAATHAVTNRTAYDIAGDLAAGLRDLTCAMPPSDGLTALTQLALCTPVAPLLGKAIKEGIKGGAEAVSAMPRQGHAASQAGAQAAGAAAGRTAVAKPLQTQAIKLLGHDERETPPLGAFLEVVSVDHSIGRSNLKLDGRYPSVPVGPGQSIGSIARAFGITGRRYEQMVTLNSEHLGGKPEHVEPGDRVYLPPPESPTGKR